MNNLCNELLGFVYRNGDDCTNNGLSSKKDMLNLLCPKEGVTEDQLIEKLEADGKNPNDYLILVKRMLWGEKHYYLKPLTEKRWVMMGGNWLYTCDSRWKDFTEHYLPLPIHDRVER